MMRRCLLVLFASIEALSASAAEIISAPKGFWLVARDVKGGQLYGATSPQADWHISQWHAPGDELRPFANDIATSKAVRVRVAGNSYEVESDGHGLVCNQEFGTYVGANNPRVYEKYPTPYKGSPPLSEMRSLTHRIGITPLVATVKSRDCPVTRGNMITSIVLRNTVRPATLFYQLRLVSVGVEPKEFWFRKGAKKNSREDGDRDPSFGYGDNIASYNVPEPRLNTRTQVEIDVLPRLLKLLKDPAVDIDRNPAHWVVSSAYHGFGIYGDVKLAARWDSFALYYD